MKNHWDRVYRTKAPTDVSWYQADPHLSLELIARVAPARSSRIIDVGGGASLLVDRLIEAGYRDLTVLDLSEEPLAIDRDRLGDAAPRVTWLHADVLTVPLPGPCDVWHDRAVFHFLTQPMDRQRYVEQVGRSVRPGGHVIVATFAEDGPSKCSGLDVVRYDAEALHREFGPRFTLLDSRSEQHHTPTGSTQSFTYCLFRTAEP